MVIIELAEDDNPEFEHQPPKVKPSSKAIPTKIDGDPVISKEPPTDSEDEKKDPGLQAQEISSSPEILPQTKASQIRPDDTLISARAEAAKHAKSKKKGDGSVEAEGDGWETASEGTSDIDDTFTDEGESSDEKEGTTSGSREEQFEDALTEEQQRTRALGQANSTKAEGNTLYAAGKYAEALDCYANALEIVVNDPSAKELCAQCYSNRAICHIQLNNYEEGVKESTKALELEPNYVKALMRRAQAAEKLEKYEDALADVKKVTELEPTNRPARESVLRLEPKAAQKREELKEEMIGKLKELGNTVLNRFGVSVDDFKAVKDPNTGSYSISFGKS